MTEIRSVIIELLSHMGSSREARQYLKRFSALDNMQFAVIKVGGGILADHLDELVDALCFLRHAGLFPITIHGAGTQLNHALAQAGIDTEIKDGLRVTTPEVMKVVRPIIYQENLRLVAALEKRGIKARGLMHGVFRCSELDRERFGLVGNVDSVAMNTISTTLAAQALPIIACLGETDAGQVLNINADSAARALVEQVQPYKVIYLTPTGGILDGQGERINAINLKTDYQALLEADWLHSGMRLKLIEIKQLLDCLPINASVSITQACHLTKELFTHRGAGTLIRRGESILLAEQIMPAHQSQLKYLLESTFNQRLKDDYFAEPFQLLYAESWHAAAVIKRGVQGVPYMDKFVVTPEAQGEGVGAALWHEIRRRFPSLYWRSRNNNPINAWYLQQSDRMLRQHDWLAFSYGISDSILSEACMESALTRTSSWCEGEVLL
jgi:acetylglutamate kinase